MLATVADPASARWLAPVLVDPGQADRVASGVRAFRAEHLRFWRDEEARAEQSGALRHARENAGI